MLDKLMDLIGFDGWVYEMDPDEGWFAGYYGWAIGDGING